MHLARVGGALAPADPVLDPPLSMTMLDESSAQAGHIASFKAQQELERDR